MKEFGALVFLGYDSGRKTEEGEEDSRMLAREKVRSGERKIQVFILFNLICQVSMSNWFPWPTKLPPRVQSKRKESSGFLMLKNCLSLRARSPVPVSRISLHPSGLVSEGRQYIYQNAQNEALSVDQRLGWSNYFSHAKR